MKEIILVRHAKSSWSNIGLKDYERPLNKRGMHDAPKMAKYLTENLSQIPQLIYSSYANRALETAKIFHSTMALDTDIDIRKSMYHSDIDDLMHVINETLDEYNCIALFGHNPTMTYMVNNFHDSVLDNLPTCGVALLQSSANRWNEVQENNTQVNSIYIPKALFY